MSGAARPGVFLDRDGTIIEDRDHLGDPEGVRLLPGAAEAIARLNRADLPAIVVTNQSGIGRGYFDEAAYFAVRDRVERLLAERGARLAATYHCPHAPDAAPPCPCRKPRPHLFQRAAREHRLDLARSYFIGDRCRDLEPGVSAGGTGYLLDGPGVAEMPVDAPYLVVDSLATAVDRLLRQR
jgi:D-glycero-D-manno-heptose 1,7-bisphosphate phosphatase